MPKSLPEELYHYTGIHGLEGIVQSQTLWATHYKYLNDAEEIAHFRDRLPEILRPVFKNIFSGLAPQQEQLLLDEYRSVDTALEEEPKKLATIMYNVTFASTGDNPPIAEPHIVSFCTVNKTDERIVNHGLLSQWRGYGARGGYAIVFDTKGLIELLAEEGKKWDYSAIFAGDVVYSTATDEELHNEFREHIDAIQKNWEQALRALDPTALKHTYMPFISCACRYKHWGFAEEREFRIVVAPTSPEIVRIGTGQGKKLLPAKPVSYFERNGTTVPYLDLFKDINGSSAKRLPVKRVIVGPHPEKERRKTDVERLLSRNNISADVSVSAIPYLG